MNRERLHKLATFLETKVESDRLDLGTWGNPNFSPDECGTVACACGWATVIFKDEGLILDTADLYSDDDTPFTTVKYEQYQSWGAVSRFFDVTYDEATQLFGGFNYPPGLITPQDVATRIKEFINV